jgi:hypothetical protein
LERDIEAWKDVTGLPNEVCSDQLHRPGQLGASDFLDMDDLRITVAGHPFDHMLYHFVLAHSNRETGTVCISESFESLSQGLQNALWELGGVPETHRIDRATAASKHLDNRRDFQRCYLALLNHYGLLPEAACAGHVHTKKDAMQSDCRIHQVFERALMLHGSRDFDERAAYEWFLREFFAQRNSRRTDGLAAEQLKLHNLPALRMAACHRRQARVTQQSTLRVFTNTYSVPSRLIGATVDIHVMADCLEVRQGEELVETVPRLRGRHKKLINYRHLIEWFACREGAFVTYRHRDAMFPTSRFRRATTLCVHTSPRAPPRTIFGS